MAEIFLSYANEDRETALRLSELLESAGWTVWWDRRIPAGRTWRSILEEALGQMRCMVVLWSKNSIESDWVKEEAEEARAVGKLVPVLIERVKPPVGFRAIQAADLSRWDGSRDAPGARQLIADLKALIGNPSAQPAVTDRGSPAVDPVPESAAGGLDDHSEVRPESRREAYHRYTPDTQRRDRKRIAAAAGGLAIALALGASLLWFKTRPDDTDQNPVTVTRETPAPKEPPAPQLLSLKIEG